MRILLFYCIVLVCACSQSPEVETEVLAPSSIETPELDMLRNSLQAMADNMDIIGFGVAVVDESGVIYADGYGLADLQKGVRYSKNTTQNIASISKVFIGVSMAKAQELGILDLNDPVNDHLPFEVHHSAYPDSIVRISHLTNHTSGITDSDGYDLSYRIALGDSLKSSELGDYAEVFLADTSWSLARYLEDYLSSSGSIYSKRNFNEFAPGTRFDYSNIGASLAALVIESASGISFSEFSTKYIFRRLNMRSTTWDMEQVDLKSRTRNFGDEGLQLPYYRLITYPDGGLNSSVQEMGVFLSELIKGFHGEGKLLSKESYGEFYTPSLDTIQNPGQDMENPFNDEYNMGLFIGQSAKGYWGHSGGDPGTATLMFFDPERKRGQVMLVNSDLNDETYFEFIGIWKELSEYSGLTD